MSAIRKFAIGLIQLVLWAGMVSASLAASAAEPDPAVGDESGDFNFNIGTWHTHIRRVRHPLTASSDVVELDGTVTVRKVWDGRAQLEEIEADGPAGHWQGMTLFLYNPGSGQWSQSFADSGTGVLQPPTIGSFKNGRGELYSQDSVAGRTILIRGVWSDIKKDSHRYEESYSDDGGQTWHIVFSAALTRVPV